MRLVGGLAIALVLAACQGGPAPSAVSISASEFSIGISDEQLLAGTVRLEVRNNGEFGHTLVVEDMNGEVLDATDVLRPGAVNDFQIDLAQGQYRLTCRIVAQTGDGELVDHYERGMVAEFDVVSG